jgi:hypothetical protein
VTEALSSYRNTKEDFRVLEKNDYHRNNVVKSQHFINVTNIKEIKYQSSFRLLNNEGLDTIDSN